MVWEEGEASEGLRTRVQPWRHVTPPPVTLGGEGERKPRDWKVMAAGEGTPGVAFSLVATGGMGNGRQAQPQSWEAKSISATFTQ